MAGHVLREAFIQPLPSVVRVYGYGYLHMAKAPNILPLKLLVISLGFLLVGGTVFVASVVIEKVGRQHSPACARATVSLAALGIKGTVSAISPGDGGIQVSVLAPDASHLLTLDRCTGKVLQQVTITP